MSKIARTVSLRADEGIWKRFSDIAHRDGLTRSALLNKLVEKEVERVRPDVHNKIKALRYDMLKIMLKCKDSEEGFRTARSILNVLDWLDGEIDSDKPIMIIAK